MTRRSALKPSKRLPACLLIFLISSGWAFTSLAQQPLAVWFGWQTDPTTTITVHWLTGANSTPVEVHYRQVGDPSWLVQPAPLVRRMPGTEHHVRWLQLTHLKPGATYEVIFDPTADDAEPRRVRLPNGNLDHGLRFIETGDMYQDEDLLHQMFALVGEQSPDFALFNGDLAYANADLERADRWVTFLQSADQNMRTPDGRCIPIVASIGNHEVVGGYGRPIEDATFFYHLFTFPGPRGYNVLDFGDDFSLVVLDSGHTNRLDGPQREWLRDTLDERENRTHLFAAYHVPAYPCVRRSGNEHSAAVREHFVPLFERYGVDLCLEAHDHAYKRTHPILDGQVHPNGIVYIGDGGFACKEQRDVAQPGTDGMLGPRRWYLSHTRATNHFVLIEILGPDRRAYAIDTEGQVFDTYHAVAGQVEAIAITPSRGIFSRAETYIALTGFTGIVLVLWWRLRRKSDNGLPDPALTEQASDDTPQNDATQAA